MKHKPRKKIKVSKNDHESVDNAQPILEPNTLSSFISYHVLYISKHELNTMTLHYSNTLKIMGHAREREREREGRPYFFLTSYFLLSCLWSANRNETASMSLYLQFGSWSPNTKICSTNDGKREFRLDPKLSAVVTFHPT